MMETTREEYERCPCCDVKLQVQQSKLWQKRCDFCFCREVEKSCGFHVQNIEGYTMECTGCDFDICSRCFKLMKTIAPSSAQIEQQNESNRIPWIYSLFFDRKRLVSYPSDTFQVCFGWAGFYHRDLLLPLVEIFINKYGKDYHWVKCMSLVLAICARVKHIEACKLFKQFNNEKTNFALAIREAMRQNSYELLDMFSQFSERSVHGFLLQNSGFGSGFRCDDLHDCMDSYNLISYPSGLQFIVRSGYGNILKNLLKFDSFRAYIIDHFDSLAELVSLAASCGHIEIVQILKETFHEDEKIKQIQLLLTVLDQNVEKFKAIILDPQFKLDADNTIAIKHAIANNETEMLEIIESNFQLEGEMLTALFYCYVLTKNSDKALELLQNPLIQPSAYENGALLTAATHNNMALVNAILQHSNIQLEKQLHGWNKTMIQLGLHRNPAVTRAVLDYGRRFALKVLAEEGAAARAKEQGTATDECQQGNRKKMCWDLSSIIAGHKADKLHHHAISLMYIYCAAGDIDSLDLVLKEYDYIPAKCFADAVFIVCSVINGSSEVLQRLLDDKRFDPSLVSHEAALNVIIGHNPSLVGLLVSAKVKMDASLMMNYAVKRELLVSVQYMLDHFKEQIAANQEQLLITVADAIELGFKDNNSIVNLLLKAEEFRFAEPLAYNRLFVVAVCASNLRVVQWLLQDAGVEIDASTPCERIPSSFDTNCSSENIRISVQAYTTVYNLVIFHRRTFSYQESLRVRNVYTWRNRRLEADDVVGIAISRAQSATKTRYPQRQQIVDDIMEILMLVLKYSSVAFSYSIFKGIFQINHNDAIKVLSLIPPENMQSSLEVAILCACESGSKVVTELLTSPHLKQIDPACLVAAVKQGNYKVIEALLADSRVDPAANDQEAICEAFHRQTEEETVELLWKDSRIDFGARQNLPYQRAAERAHPFIFEMLISYSRFDPSVNGDKILFNFGSREWDASQNVKLMEKLVNHPKMHLSTELLRLAIENGYKEISMLLANKEAINVHDAVEANLKNYSLKSEELIEKLVVHERLSPSQTQELRATLNVLIDGTEKTAREKHGREAVTWTLEKEGVDEAAPPYTSRVAGTRPALYSDEEWPLFDQCKEEDYGYVHFAFQLDLSTVPKRVQELFQASSGLFQLFILDFGGGDPEHFMRIIPAADFPKLISSSDPFLDLRTEEELEDRPPVPKERAIASWTSQSDFPPFKTPKTLEQRYCQKHHLKRGIKFGGYAEEGKKQPIFLFVGDRVLTDDDDDGKDRVLTDDDDDGKTPHFHCCDGYNTYRVWYKKKKFICDSM